MKNLCFYGCRPEESTLGRPRVSPATATLRKGGDYDTDKYDKTKTAEVSQKINHTFCLEGMK